MAGPGKGTQTVKKRQRRVDLSQESCECCGEGCPEKLWPVPPEPGMGIHCANCFTAIRRNGWCPDEEGYCSPSAHGK